MPNGYNTVLAVLLIWRYLRQIVHLVAFWLYRPAEPMADPPLTGKDVTVLIPTIDPGNSLFVAGLMSVLRNRPAEVIVVTVGDELLRRVNELLASLGTSACSA